MNIFTANSLNQFILILVELVIGFFLFWLGQLTYKNLFRKINLNLELFVKDNPATATALVGYYFGIVIALGGVLGQTIKSWQATVLYLTTYGIAVILLMLIGAWISDRFILRQCDTAREIQEERNLGAAMVEAGTHVANGLILSAALAGEGGSLWIGIISWLMGLGVLIIVSYLYPFITHYNVFREIEKRNNPAAGVALSGLLIATGMVIKVSLSPEFQGLITFLSYAMMLGVGLILLVIIRWFADLVLVPGVKISNEIVRQEIPNLGTGLIEAFAYIGSSFLIAWTLGA